MDREQEVEMLQFLIALSEAKLLVKKFILGLIPEHEVKEYLREELREFETWYMEF